MKVLVTGAAGFVGGHLVPALHAAGHRVSGLGDTPPPAGLALDAWHSADLADREALEAAVAATAPDAVVHLAGQSSVSRSFEDPEATFRANVLGTWHLLEATRVAAPRARVLVVGSGEVYGSIPPGTRAGEDAPLAPLSPYALSKAAADALAEVHARAHGLEVVRTRSFGHAGPGQTTRFVLPAFASQIAAIERGVADPVLRVGNLEVTRDLSDVRDIVRAYRLLIERGRAGAAYNVCRGEGVRLIDVVGRLVSMARVPVRVEVDPARFRPADLPHLVGDPAAIARDTGWRAEIPIERTLSDVLEEWRRREAGA
jgi:GDP-4-dehydro-6-deoxy-D-mannose reductase